MKRACTGLDDQGIDAGSRVIVAVDPGYFRPAEVGLPYNASKAKRKLGWELTVGSDELVRDMAAGDLRVAQPDALITQHGYCAADFNE